MNSLVLIVGGEAVVLHTKKKGTKTFARQVPFSQDSF